MSLINYFSPSLTENDLPTLFLSPFNNKPHPLAVEASKQLQEQLNSTSDWQHNFDAQDGGKMFGVLVVKNSQNRIGFLTAFSGMLAKKWQLPSFVPPLFDQAILNTFLPNGEAQLLLYSQQIDALIKNPAYNDLQVQLKQLIQQRETDLTALDKTHKHQKQDRQRQRATIRNKPKLAQEKLLSKLSFESQEDKRGKKWMINQWQTHVTNITQQIKIIDNEIESLKKLRTKLSVNLQQKIFSTYTVINRFGEQKNISDFFKNAQPPGGTGDCAAPKLIQYANQHQLIPLAIAEFWWGTSPNNDIRHHGHYYPACRGKCHPILPFMLKGINMQAYAAPGSRYANPQMPEIIYEDDVLLVINKPNGLLSIPGKATQDSVFSRLQKCYPNATGPLLVHRLDLDTSGLLLIAKTAVIYKKLQQQFIQRTIKKRYVAILSKSLPDNMPDNGKIELPLRVDFDDRPRQMVCITHGKFAKTHWKIISKAPDTTRLYLYPVTGRTHQLRVHMAHASGLNSPIIGDRLYGTESDRLYLHAENLCFSHPLTGRKIEIKSTAPF